MARRASRQRTLDILAQIPVSVRAKMKPVIEGLAKEITAAQRAAAPKKTGKLVASIRYTFGTVTLASSGNLAAGASGTRRGDADLTVQIIAGDRVAWYARQVEFGVKPHVIEPKRTGVFGMRGSLVINGNVLPPGQSVQHPGSAPHPFFYGPFRAREKTAKATVRKAMNAAVKEAARD